MSGKFYAAPDNTRNTKNTKFDVTDDSGDENNGKATDNVPTLTKLIACYKAVKMF